MMPPLPWTSALRLRFAAVTKSTGDGWVGVPALAKELGIAIRTVYGILDTGDLPSYKFGRVIRVRRADVETYLERVKVRPGELAHLYDQRDGGVRRRSIE